MAPLLRNSSRLLCAVTLLLASPTVASAESRSDTEAAERAFTEALTLMDAGRYGEACPKLELSDHLAPASGTLLNLADCYEHVGRIGSAWKAFEGAAERARANGKHERERVAHERAALLVPRLSRLALVSPLEVPPGLSLALDGAALSGAAWSTPVVVDPGAHVLQARAPGRQSFSTTLGPVAEGRIITLQIPNLAKVDSAAVGAEPAKAAPQPIDAQRLGATVSAGVGLAGLVVGTVFGLHSMSRHEESDRHCEGDGCDASGVNAMREARAAGDRATVGFIIGGVGLAAASVLWFVRPFSSQSQPPTQVGVGPSGVVLRGAF
jgi:hypothetical protein